MMGKPHPPCLLVYSVLPVPLAARHGNARECEIEGEESQFGGICGGVRMALQHLIKKLQCKFDNGVWIRKESTVGCGSLGEGSCDELLRGMVGSQTNQNRSQGLVKGRTWTVTCQKQYLSFQYPKNVLLHMQLIPMRPAKQA